MLYCAHRGRKGHCCTYHHMFNVIWTHPSAQGHGSEWWLKAVHVEQEGAIVTLDERGHSTTPAEKKSGHFCGKMGELKTTSTPNNILPHPPPPMIQSRSRLERWMKLGATMRLSVILSSKRTVSCQEVNVYVEYANVAVGACMINAQYPLGEDSQLYLIFLLLKKKKATTALNNKRILATFLKSTIARTLPSA